MFPQIADGGGWKTTVTLVKIDKGDAIYTLSFFHSDGTPMEFSIAGVGSVSEISGMLPVKTSRVFETTASGRITTSGWAYLDTWNYIGGNAIFRQQAPGRRSINSR